MTGQAETRAVGLACPLCGDPVTMPRTENREDEFAIYVVVTDPGTWHAHHRDAHPESWAQACEMQRKMNANPYIGGMPRKVNGTFLRAGQDVGDLP